MEWGRISRKIFNNGIEFEFLSIIEGDIAEHACCNRIIKTAITRRNHTDIFAKIDNIRRKMR